MKKNKQMANGFDMPQISINKGFGWLSVCCKKIYICCSDKSSDVFMLQRDVILLQIFILCFAICDEKEEN
jgi:hypothetical protein